MGYIYKITNNINQKNYIGLTTKTVEQRWQEHIGAIQKHKENRPLYKAMSKYGIANFSISTIEEVDNELLSERERFWIEYYDSYKNGYNATLGGDGRWTRKIEQYSLDGQLIQVFDTITQASNTMNISESVLRGVCNKKYKTAKKYLFKYADDETLVEELVQNAKTNNYYKTIVCQYSLSGQLINIWDSIDDAKKNTGISNISRGLNHSKPTSGYIWRTLDKTFYDNLDLTSIIVQLSIEDDQKLNYYDSFLSAAKALGKNTGSAISEACRNIGYHKTAYGYKWRYLRDVL